MAQFARPDSDVSAGGWEPQGGPSTLWEAVDEVSPSDTDYIEALNGENITCELGLTTLTDPGGSSSGADYHLRVRMQGTGSGGPERLMILLFEGATQRAASGNFASRAAWTTQTYTLTAGEADAISNFADLRVKLTSSNLAETEDMWASWVEFEIPSPPAGGLVLLATHHYKQMRGA